MNLLNKAGEVVKAFNKKRKYVPVGIKCGTDPKIFYNREGYDLIEELLFEYCVKKGLDYKLILGIDLDTNTDTYLDMGAGI